MKRVSVLTLSIGLIIVFVISGALFVTTTLSVFNLKKELVQVQNNLDSAYRAKENVDLFEINKTEFLRKEKEHLKTIPLNESEPLRVIKEITILANSAGIKNFLFSLKKISPAQINGQSSASGSNSNALDSSGGSSGSGPGSGAGEDEAGGISLGSNSETRAGLYFSAIYMDFEAEFNDLLEFIHKVLSLKRLVIIDNLKISRSEKTFPLQKVKLAVSVYTLVSP
jgi:Tfp pilus assembly protein PilO